MNEQLVQASSSLAKPASAVPVSSEVHPVTTLFWPAAPPKVFLIWTLKNVFAATPEPRLPNRQPVIELSRPPLIVMSFCSPFWNVQPVMAVFLQEPLTPSQIAS